MHRSTFVSFVSFLTIVLTTPSLALAADRAVPSIYKCEVGGVMTFTDRPCGLKAEVHTPDSTVMNTYEAPPVADAPPPTATSKPRKRAAVTENGAAKAKQAQDCARYAQGMKEIRSKMRSGYSAKEGERLRARADKLRASQRTARCS